MTRRQRAWGCGIWWGGHEIRATRRQKLDPTRTSRRRNSDIMQQGGPPIRQLCLELPYTYFPLSTDEFSAFLDSNAPIEREILQCTEKHNDTLLVPGPPYPKPKPEIRRRAVVGEPASAFGLQRNLNRQYQIFNALTIMASPFITCSLNVGTMDLSSSPRVSLLSVSSIPSAVPPKEAG